MDNLKDIYEGILDVDNIGKTLESIPYKFTPSVVWEFLTCKMGRIYDKNKNHIGFYELYGTGKEKFVTLYVSSERQRLWLDEKATDKVCSPIPIEIIRDIVIKNFKLKKDIESVFIWNPVDYIDSIDGGSVPELDDNELGWKHWMNTFQGFFGVTAKTPIDRQIKFSKGDYY